MELSVQVFIICLVAGLILVGAEIFVPGGIIGSIGALLLLIAVIDGFIAFPSGGPYIALAIVFFVGLAFYLWIRFFPETGIGRLMTVPNSLATFKGTETGLEQLLGKDGTAVSELRPAGFALIDGRRIDVVTQGGMIGKGEAVRVVEVESNRVIVAHVPAQSATPTA